MKSRSGLESRLGRRTFIKIGAAGGLAAASGGLACTADLTSELQDESQTTPSRFELSEATIRDLQKGMESGTLTSRRITELYLERIESIDRNGPGLKAVIETNPDAEEIAEALDSERHEKGSRGPLHGIPIILKDNIDTHDRMTTTAGSLALEGSIPLSDSFVARRLREAGAVLLAKANMSEWANFRSENSSSGWSGRGGQCLNPYALDRNPCGSSSGSGVVASANLAAGTIGTETNGSIMCPSNANGVVGIKPTVGLVSRTGIIPISETQDTAGPITRTVADAAAMLTVLAGVDPKDPATEQAGKGLLDYTQFLVKDGLEGARIGICREFFGFNPRVDALLEASILEIERLGATLVDDVAIPGRRRLNRPSYTVLLYEFKDGLNRYLSGLDPQVKVKSLEDIIYFNEENSKREMPFFGQDILILSQQKDSLTSEEYLNALKTCTELSREKGIDKVMEDRDLDAMIGPTGGPAWLTDHINGDHFSGGSSSPAAIAGYPNITVPMGSVHGLPVGISFFGRAWSEAELIRFAYSFEQATLARQEPEFKVTIEV